MTIPERALELLRQARYGTQVDYLGTLVDLRELLEPFKIIKIKNATNITTDRGGVKGNSTKKMGDKKISR